MPIVKQLLKRLKILFLLPILSACEPGASGPIVDACISEFDAKSPTIHRFSCRKKTTGEEFFKDMYDMKNWQCWDALDTNLELTHCKPGADPVAVSVYFINRDNSTFVGSHQILAWGPTTNNFVCFALADARIVDQYCDKEREKQKD